MDFITGIPIFANGFNAIFTCGSFDQVYCLNYMYFGGWGVERLLSSTNVVVFMPALMGDMFKTVLY